MAESPLSRVGRRIWYAAPSAGVRTSSSANVELSSTLEPLLDNAIEAATRTGDAADRLSRTLAAFHAWTLQQLEATQVAAGA